MGKIKGIYFLLLVVIIGMLMTNCKKPSERKCFKGIGNQKNIRIDDTELQMPNVELSDNISVELVNDSLNYIELLGGENLVGFISFLTDGDTLKIKDTNKCSILRNHKDAFKVVYHYTQLDRVTLLGYGALTNRDTLRHNVLVIANNSFSTIDLKVNNDDTHISIPLGNVPVNIVGKTTSFFVYSSGHSAVRAENLFAYNAHGHSKGIADFHIRASNFMNVELYLKGNFYIYGNPIQKKYSDEGIGQIIEVN